MAKFKVGDKVKFVIYHKIDPVPKWVQESANKEILTIAGIINSYGTEPTYIVEELPYAYSEKWIEPIEKPISDIHDAWCDCFVEPIELTVEEALMMYNPSKYYIKEENTMKPNYNAMTPINPNPYEDPEDIAYDQKVKALQDEAEQKIFDIRRELAHALEKLRVERNEKANKEREQRMAKVWKTKYDALVEAGFTAEQAWEMTMKCFELD